MTVNSYWDVFEASVGKVDMNRFRFIKLDVSRSFETVANLNHVDLTG
jgi:hypothetical protein